MSVRARPASRRPRACRCRAGAHPRPPRPGRSRERRRDRAHALCHAEAVLEQPVAVGLVVELRRRRHPVDGPEPGVLREDPLEQSPQVAALDRRRAAPSGPPPSGRAARGAVQQILDREAPRLRRREPAQADLRPEAGMPVVAAPARAPARRRAGSARAARRPPRPWQRPRPCDRPAARACTRPRRAWIAVRPRARAAPDRPRSRP